MKSAYKKGGTRIIQAEVQNNNGSCNEVTSKYGIEKSITTENKEKLKQPFDIPIMQEPLLNDFVLGENLPSSLEVLQRTYKPPEDLDKYPKTFTKYLKLLDEVYQSQCIPITFTTDQYQWECKKQKEETSSSTEGIHFGNYK